MSTWKITCFAPPPLNAATKCITAPITSNHPTSSVAARPATPGSIIANIPRMMNSTAAAIYQPVTFFATPKGPCNPCAGFAVAMRHLHSDLALAVFAVSRERVTLGGCAAILTRLLFRCTILLCHRPVSLREAGKTGCPLLKHIHNRPAAVFYIPFIFLLHRLHHACSLPCHNSVRLYGL